MGPLRLIMTFNAIRDIRSALAVKSTRDTSAYIIRLTATATFAYLLATLIPGTTDRPVLAPLTALLVLQASLYQTISSGLKKVLSVAAGVLVAVGLAEFIGFSWWQLMLVIAAALLIGRVLRLGEDLLEVPISAMLIFASAGQHAAATGRVVDTLVGTAAGLLGGLAFASLRVQPARAAVCGLAGRLATLLDRMGADLVDDPEPALVTEWLVEARALRDEIERVDDTLRETADSAKLNPRALIGTAESVPVGEMNGVADGRPGGARARGADRARAGPLGAGRRPDRQLRQPVQGRGHPGAPGRRAHPARRGDPDLRGAGADDAGRQRVA